MAKHTPGPWTVEPPYHGFSAIYAGDRLVFGLAAGADDEKQPDDVCEANALLIKAAPDMHAALIRARQQIAVDLQGRARANDESREDADGILAEIDAALAKATPEEEK